MPIIEEEVIGSQSEDNQPNEELNQQIDASMDEALKAFGIEEEEEEKSVNDKTPAKEDVKTDVKKTIVKYNKEDVEIDDDKIPELLQKGLALDKERERKTDLEKTLDRVAKLAGFKDHTEYAANLDKLEQQQQQKKQDDLTTFKNEMRQEFIDSGFDPDKVDAYIDSHPLLQRAREAVQKDEERSAQEIQAKTQEQHQKVWQELYNEFPDIVESSKVFVEGKEPDWYNAEMKSRIAKGYEPLDAYRLAHMSTIQQQTKKATEQRIIKEQQLGLRSRVETNTNPDSEPQVPAELASAFAAFGLPAESAKKYIKK